eukprot:5368156-Pyramimonas_sp.AAC.1
MLEAVLSNVDAMRRSLDPRMSRRWASSSAAELFPAEVELPMSTALVLPGRGTACEDGTFETNH